MAEEIVNLVVGIMTGGSLAGLITALVSAKKSRIDIDTTNIENAIKIRDEAVKEYQSIGEKLEIARELLNEAQEQLEVAKKYIDTLCDILDNNGIGYPPRPHEVYNRDE